MYYNLCYDIIKYVHIYVFSPHICNLEWAILHIFLILETYFLILMHFNSWLGLCVFICKRILRYLLLLQIHVIYVLLSHLSHLSIWKLLYLVQFLHWVWICLIAYCVGHMYVIETPQKSPAIQFWALISCLLLFYDSLIWYHWKVHLFPFTLIPNL